MHIQCESKKIPLRFCDNFSKTVGNFLTKFNVPITCSYLLIIIMTFVHKVHILHNTYILLDNTDKTL